MTTSFAAELAALSSKSLEFGYLVDHGRASECSTLFTPDAKLIFAAGSPRPGTIEGIEAIRAFLASRQAQLQVTTRHQATQLSHAMGWRCGSHARLVADRLPLRR